METIEELMKPENSQKFEDAIRACLADYKPYIIRKARAIADSGAIDGKRFYTDDLIKIAALLVFEEQLTRVASKELPNIRCFL